MSTLGIVVLSLLGGLFIALLIGAVVFLIWVCLRLRQTVTDSMTELSKAVELHAQQIATFQSNTRAILQLHADVMNKAISKINGEGLELASKSILQSAERIQKACLAFGELAQYILADRDTIASNGAGLQPDEYATPEPGERFTKLSSAAAEDIHAFAEEEDEQNQSTLT